MSQPAAASSGHRETLVVDGEDMRRATKRIAHEIVERNGEGCDLLLAGIPTRGVPLALRLAALINTLGGAHAEVLELDVQRHRDDRDPDESGRIPAGTGAAAIDGRVVVLVDDVIYHGRTARAALDALTELGRPAGVQLAVMVDRGHRELPIRADYVGKNIPTQLSDRVRVLLDEVDGIDAVYLMRDE
jgi:pyrimidine operon attenuation protein/uracil phosphoribosyltransferase